MLKVKSHFRSTVRARTRTRSLKKTELQFPYVE
jgi:hypothetical protein